MANMIPIKQHSPEPGLAEFETGDTLAIEHGGTGQSTPANALSALGGASQVSLNSHINNQQKHLTLSVINGEIVPTFPEPIRGKLLSISMNNFSWSEAQVNNNEWFQVAHATDRDSGYIMPFNGTIVGYTAHCEDLDGNSKPIRLYVNGSEISVLGTLTGGTNVIVRDVTLDINFNQDDRLRLRGGTGGSILDTVVTLFVRWRA